MRPERANQSGGERWSATADERGWSGQIIGVQGARPEPDASLVQFGDEYWIPERFTGWFRPADPAAPECYVEVVIENGRPVCQSVLCVRRPGGDPITSTALRKVNVSTLARWAARLLISGSDGIPFVESDSSAPPADVLAAYRRAMQPRGRGIRVTDDQLSGAADIYRSALRNGQPPTQAVERDLHISRATAGRWVMEARKRGFLGAALPGRAGEKT